MPVAVVAPTMTTFADVRDMARAHVLAAERGVRGETYLLGNEDLWIEDVARMAMDVVGVRKPIVNAPFFAASLAAHAAKTWADRVTRRAPLFTPEAIRIARLGLRADCTKARHELGMPQSPIRDAVRDAIGWFEREGFLRHWQGGRTRTGVVASGPTSTPS
jgi:dihydroflavonol-4-reductase